MARLTYSISNRIDPRWNYSIRNRIGDLQNYSTYSDLFKPLLVTKLCVLRTVHAAGSGFRRRHRALCAGRCTLGRLFRLRDAARPRTWWYAIVHGIRDKVRITNSWQSSGTCPQLMLLVLCMGWNFDAGTQISRKFGGETMHVMHES